MKIEDIAHVHVMFMKCSYCSYCSCNVHESKMQIFIISNSIKIKILRTDTNLIK